MEVPCNEYLKDSKIEYMYYILPQLNFVLATGGLLLAVVTIALYIDLFAFRGAKFSSLIKKLFWPLTILTTTGSIALSLLYSEYFGFIPCSLCWLQRIAIYPQAILAITAWKLKDAVFFPIYGIGLSLFGLVVAIYQYIYQMLPPEKIAEGLMPCLADGSNADCAVKVIDQFGFVTFSLLSAITFTFLIALYLYQLRANKK